MTYKGAIKNSTNLIWKWTTIRAIFATPKTAPCCRGNRLEDGPTV